MKSLLVSFCVHKTKERIKFKQELEKELEELQQKLDNNPNTETQNLYKLNKSELEQIEKDEVNKQIFKSRIKWIEDEEKGSKFFLPLETKNYTDKLIKALDIDGTIIKEPDKISKLIKALDIDGTIIKEPDKISKGQSTYYQGLYSEKLNKNDKSYKDTLNTFLLNNDIPQLNEEQKNSCDKSMTKQEILSSIKQLTNGKTPRNRWFIIRFL